MTFLIPLIAAAAGGLRHHRAARPRDGKSSRTRLPSGPSSPRGFGGDARRLRRPEPHPRLRRGRGRHQAVGLDPGDRVPRRYGLFVDPLTACLLIVVTTIGMLVHIYSIGYMAHDEGKWRFFAYLNLFMFSDADAEFLADNFLLVFAGWELVGWCSYLLIGFCSRAGPRRLWNNRPTSAAAQELLAWGPASPSFRKWNLPSSSAPPKTAKCTCVESSSTKTRHLLSRGSCGGGSVPRPRRCPHGTLTSDARL